MTDDTDHEQVLTRKALAWTPSLPHEDMKTYWGGYPTWPVDVPWPTRKTGQAVFLAQFDLADLPWRPEGWPETGTLYLFDDPLTERNYGKCTDSFCVYFATSDRACALTKPSCKLSNMRTHLYGGGLVRGKWNDETIWFENDALANYALQLVEFDDYWSFDPHDDDDVEFVREERSDSIWSATAPFGVDMTREKVDQKWRTGSANLIDPNKLRLEIPRLGLVGEVPDDPRASEWPLATGHILYHASGIYEANHRVPSSPKLRKSVAWDVCDGAKSWAEWAHKQGHRVLTLVEKDEYKAWCQSKFESVIPAWKRITPLELPQNVTPRLGGGIPTVFKRARKKLEAGSEKENEYHVLSTIIKQFFQFHPYWTDFGLISLDVAELRDLPNWAQDKYLEQCAAGQLFGFGHDEQGQVGRHFNQLFLADILRGGDVSVGDVYKVWLVGDLKPNAWQRTIVEHPA